MSIRAPFHANSGAIIFKAKHVGRHFCSDFQGVLKFSEMLHRVWRMFLGQHLGVRLHPLATPPPTPVLPTQVHYLLFHQRDHPGIQTAVTVQLLQNC